MGSVRRALGSLLAVSARRASGSVSWDAAPRVGTRLASLRTVDARWYRHLGAIIAPSVPGGGGPSRAGYAPRAARTSRRATRMHAMPWACASDHWRGLSTVAGDDAPDDSDADDAAAADDDDEAAFADVDDDDIAAYDDDDDDDDDEVTSTSVASDPAHVRPRREIHGFVTDRDVARCPLDQLRDLVEEYHDVFDGGAAALALKKMATNGMFLVDSTDQDRRVVAHEDEEEHSGGAEDGPSSTGRKSAHPLAPPARGVRAGVNTSTRVHPSVDLLLQAVAREASTMGPREATRCMYALMVMNVARGRPGRDAVVSALDERLGECAPTMHGKHAAIALFSSAKLRREMRDAEIARRREDAEEVGGSNPGGVGVGAGGGTFTARGGPRTSMRASDAALVDAVARTAGDDMSADDIAKAMRGVAIWIDTLGRNVGRLTRAVDAINVGLVRCLVDEAEVGGSNPDGIDDVWDASAPKGGSAKLTPHAAMSILSSHRVLARHGAGRADPRFVQALTLAMDAVLDAIAAGDDKIGAGLFLTAVNALAKARRSAGVDEPIPAELKAKIDERVADFCERRDVEAWFPGSAILALAALAQTQASIADGETCWEVSGALAGALERCLERFEKRSTHGEAVATIFAYDAAIRELDSNLVAPPVVDRMRVTLEETLTRMSPARAARLLDKQCKTAMDAFGKEAASLESRRKSPDGELAVSGISSGTSASAMMSPAHLDAAFRAACVGAGELNGSQLASLARAAAWFYAMGDDAMGGRSPMTPPTDEMIAGLDGAAGSLARSGTVTAGTAAVLLRCFCELRGVGWRRGDPTDGGVFKVSNHALRDLLSAAEDGIPEFESVAMDGFTRAVRMLDGFNGDAVVGERVKFRVEARMAELLSTRRLLADSPKSKEAYYFGRGGVLNHLDQWIKTFADVPGPVHTKLMNQFRSQIGDSVSHMTREHAAEVLKLLASDDSKKPMTKLMSKSSIGTLLKKALLEQHETKGTMRAKYEGRDLVDLTRSVANLVRNMEESHERRKHSKRKERFMTPITPTMVKSLTWNISRECKRHHSESPLEPGAYVEMLQSLATVGNWGRGRFFLESVASPQSVVSRLAAKISHPESIGALSYGEVIAAGRCLVALDETVVRLGGIFDTIDRVFDTASMRKLAGALRRRTLAEDTFTTPARVFAETARISFLLDKEGGRPPDDADDDENWTRWFERCARCITSANDDGAAAAQFLRMLSHACAKSPSYLAARVPVDVISSVSDAAAAGGSNETLENGPLDETLEIGPLDETLEIGPLGNPERVLLIAGALARFAAAGADVPAAKLAESAAAAERALIEAAENRRSVRRSRRSRHAFSAGALATFATLRVLPEGYHPSEEARRALSEALLADAPRWVARFVHFDHLASLALGPKNGSETLENGSETLEAEPPFPELAAVCEALRASSLRGQRLLDTAEGETGTAKSPKLPWFAQDARRKPLEDARRAANAAEACARLAEAGLARWRRGGDECEVWRNVAESVVGGEDGAAFVKSLRSAFEGVARGSGSPETPFGSETSSSSEAGLTETDAEVKRRLGLAVGRLEAAREELTKGPVGGFFSSLFG